MVLGWPRNEAKLHRRIRGMSAGHRRAQVATGRWRHLSFVLLMRMRMLVRLPVWL